MLSLALAPLSLNTPVRAPGTKMVAISTKKAEFAPAGEFDPAQFLAGKSKGEVYRLREAELTHGRVGMLASAGFLVQEFWHPLFTADGGPAIEQIPKLPVPLWFGMTLGIGICETLRIQKGWANPYEL